MAQVVYEYKNSNTDEIILEEAKEDACKKAETARENIEGELDSTSLLAEKVATDLSSGKLGNDSILEKRIRAEMDSNSEIFCITVAYSPAAHAGELYSPCFKNNGSAVVPAPIKYDYTNVNDNNNTEWYNKALNAGGAVWNPPYYGTAAGTYLIDYSTPFYLAEFKNGDEAAGVVCVSHSLEGVRAQVGNLDLGNTGYGFILSEEGVIISYPVREYLYKDISKLTTEEPNLDLISQNMTVEEYRDVINSRTGQSSWVFYENISSTDWTMGIVLPQEETLLDKKVEQNRSVIQIVLATFAFLFFLSLLFISLYSYNHRRLWMLAFIFSFLCILGMGVIWHITLNDSPVDGRNGDLVVFDMTDVETVLQHSGTSSETQRVPTGVFLQSMEFSTANDVVITGQIWQYLSGSGIDYASPSFSFPESKETTIEKAYEDQNKGIVGWRFKTTLRQQFDYSRYPFDREDVWIKFWGNASAGSVLVPDFDSYESLVPETLPGLERSIVLEGWDPQKTFFSYRVNSYNTNFGIGDFTHSDVSELYFNVGVKRDFKAPFVSDLLPIMVVAILLFAVLVITTREEQKNQFGFSSSGVLAYCAALFFVLIVSHSSLRANIPTDSIIYLEYFYLIMYLAILGVSLNSIAFASRVEIPFIDAKDNLYVKVLYWPVIMGALLVITLLNFY